MVQGKSPEQKRSHGGVERQFSSDLHQDTSGSRVGADLEKKLKKKVRSMKISGFDSLEHSPTMDFQFKKTAFSPIRNYMKPTRSSDARKGKLRATVTSPASTDKKNSNSFMASSSSSSSPAAPAKKCSAVSSCAKKNLNRATCSSTLKDYKFPAALVINPEGKSKMRVCPYTYCSLNGHIHELSSPPPPPPLKRFISERRRILENRRSMDVQTLFSVKTRDNEEERIGEERVNDIIEIPSDLFAEIYYTMPPEEIIGEKNCGEINIQDEKDQEQDCAFDESQSLYVVDHVSEYSRDQLEVDDEGKAQEDYEFEVNGDGKNSGIESLDMDCEAEDDSEEKESEAKHNSPETANILEYVEADSEGKSQKDNEFEENGDGKNSGIQSKNMDCEEEESETEHSSPETADLPPSEDESSNLEDINGTAETMLNTSGIDLKETGGVLSSKWNITRKMTTEESEQAKEFNPKPPNFLPLEPDPEDEKVDLRHQMMDGRRSAEEWMIDYALQHAVTRLGDPARKKKKKVALLVEAFETVVPQHTCETPASHGTSSFTNLSFIQACS